MSTYRNPITTILLFVFLGFSYQSFSQNKSQAYVDAKGVIRWGGTNEEVHGFGVNYTAPFAHAYRSAKKLGVDIKKAIDDDVYHFSRLGFDLYRVHVWDTEISDSVGNLLENEHLDAFDYLVNKLKERGINYVITPIAFWGNGWPEPDDDTPGFSHKYGKGDCLTDPGAIAAQENYLSQFVAHINPYTGLAYKDDPGVIAFEVSNEPHHRGEPESVTEFIQKMVAAIRKTGCEKPVFYNISHSVHLAEDYFKADIQGGTFQWYPTGLGFQKELQGNFLPNVDDYNIPFDNAIKDNGGGKLVYEFDAADVARSYIYPAMARSFRTAGIQIATHFSYEPTYLAYANTEYNTHYMNLVYAPQKALSLKVASEVFHKVPMYEDYGVYPQNTTFDNFRVSYEDDLAEYMDNEKMIYTNSTKSKIPDTKKLESISGFGNSEVVKYEGQGAYFLDKVEKGVWRLEVMPDAVWVDNLFGRNSLDRRLAAIKWNEWSMEVNLPDLESDFIVKPINKGNTYSSQVKGNHFSIKPGTYLLTKAGSKTKIKGDEAFGNISLNEFVSPSSDIDKIFVSHQPITELTVGNKLTINAQVVGPDQPKEILVYYYQGWRLATIQMQRTYGYYYSAEAPVELQENGYFRYFITLKTDDDYITYPSEVSGKPGDWDFQNANSYQTKVLSANNPIYLFDAFQDSDYLMREWVQGSGMVPSAEPGKGEYIMNVEKLFKTDPENSEAEKVYDYSVKYYFIDKVSGRKAELPDKTKLVFKGRSLNERPCQLQLAFTMKDGAAYGGLITVNPEKADYTLSTDDIKQVKFVTLPRPYPSFLPYFYENPIPQPFNIQNAESLQISIGPGIPENQLEGKHGVAIESIRLE